MVQQQEQTFGVKLRQQQDILDLRRRQYEKVQKAYQEQKEEIKELQSVVQQLQEQQATLAQALSAQAPSAQAPPASPSLSTKAKEPRQPSSYKPPQSRICWRLQQLQTLNGTTSTS